ncbi:MAG: hypothetical protein QM528_02250 [Phycisphaerales bacterium]|nr:hypothetical protein [Phycisphaerales bacterium]
MKNIEIFLKVGTYLKREELKNLEGGKSCSGDDTQCVGFCNDGSNGHCSGPYGSCTCTPAGF